MKVPPGRYSVVAYNYNTESIRIRGEESYETIEALYRKLQWFRDYRNGKDGLVTGPHCMC